MSAIEMRATPDYGARPASETVKRLVDVSGALVALVAATPVLLVAMIAIRVTMGAPIFFVQPRTGRGGRTFRLWKLRTMRAAVPDATPIAGAPGAAGHPERGGAARARAAHDEAAPPGDGDAARLTPLGRRLRTWSIDELPQLWNVLRGDMSLVGPRPLLPRYLERYSLTQARRHEVRPGITGLAQVRGRNALSWEEKFALDVWYVDHHTLRLDLWVLWRTARALVRRDGISAAGCATMPEFRGTRDEGARCATS